MLCSKNLINLSVFIPPFSYKSQFTTPFTEIANTSVYFLNTSCYFQSYIIIRLPALFGDGLKKNALYDLLNNNEPEKIIGENEYQWYNINWLNQDINLLLENDFHGLINFCSQPISMISIINENNIKLKINLKAPPTILYDVNSIHSKYFNLNYDYKYTHNINNVRDCLNSFIKNYRV
jgi:hypothetical protein